jgi:sugar lactone lactonase YvrE
MTAWRIPTQVRRGPTLVAAALVAWSGLFYPPLRAHPTFPGFTPISNTPSGVAMDKAGDLYVSVRNAVIYGLAAAADGDVYAAMATGVDQGVYRVDRYGNIERLPGTEQIVLANGLAFDDRGTLYVTESYSGSPGAYGQGGLWRIPKGGEAELLLRDPLLTGIGILGFPIGANGVAYFHRALFVTNTDKGLVLRVPIAKDGSAAGIELWKRLDEVPESPLAGARLPVMPDGIALDVHGNLYLAIVSRNAVVRLNIIDRAQESIAVLGSPGPIPSAPLDTPASLVFGTGGGEQQNLFVTNLGMMAAIIPGPPWPGRALVKVPAGVPGRPIH